MNTIVAIATASGVGAIALIRVSGEGAVGLVDSVFTKTKDQRPKTEIGVKSKDLRLRSFSLKGQESWTLHFGKIIDNDRVIDEVVVSLFRSPRSYTGEDLVEISCHGSEYIQHEILQLLIRKGGRMASPGEFTQRAFLNGKLDLSQAEAVSDLIASSSRASHQLAMDQIRGGFSSEISELRMRLLELVSLIELELDFSEEDVEFADRSRLRDIVGDIQLKVDSLVGSFQLGNVLKNGVPVAIVGETNVGKSTLLNAILKEDKAIVSDIAGTTRDVIEDTIHVGGILFRFIDTAGLRHTDDTIESMGIERSYQQIEKARIVILVTDPTAPEEQSLKWVKAVQNRIREDQGFVIVVNKGDVEDLSIARLSTIESSVISTQSSESKKLRIVLVSAKYRSGLEELERALLDHVNLQPLEDHDVIVTNARHYDALVRVQEAVMRVMSGLDTGISGDFLSQDIREILHYLGEITGEISTDEILGNIFASFCIGK
ncbi:MAG: tRNA uridine-5-carboxymethylaminomethyl(34) synthesis GTPase MnmE [Bacteroidales bacterium]|nr:tRNA uridine-5-carboxymethylaminomethyl(34) synthesis GTPase MnmE [Bacteroidales bacterium]